MAKQKILTPEQEEEIRTKDLFDCILPGNIKFLSDYYICGNDYCCAWAIKSYPPTTEEQALFSQLSDKAGITLHTYNRPVEALEQRKIIQDAARKNTMQSASNDVNETVQANENLQDVVEMLSNLRKNKEPLIHSAVFIGLSAKSLDELKELQSEVDMELQRSHIEVDKLLLRQREGFWGGGR